MNTFENKLDYLIEDAITKMRVLINNKGEKSKHISNNVLIITDDDLMFNIEGENYLKEISEYNLIDNRGYSYSFFAIEIENLMKITDYFIEKYK